MKIDLRISGIMYEVIKAHLFPGDGKESVALALCGTATCDDSMRILVHKVVIIPIEDCIIRTPTTVHWRTHKLIEVLELASRKNFSILKIHSHPTGYSSFSDIDDRSDKELFTTAFSWIDDVAIHASAVMLPDGKIFGRAYSFDLSFKTLEVISIIGDEIKFFHEAKNDGVAEFNVRTAQAFGLGTTSLLKNLSVAVIGCSGTGSPTIEQLARLGFGRILLIDPDRIEVKNLNRILGSRMEDAVSGKLKVDVLKDYIDSVALGTVVESYAVNLYDDISVIKKVAQCDVVLGSMDSVDGRQLLNSIATFYLLPYFDLGVKLIADGFGGIDQIWSTVHYIQPGKSSLMTRGVFTVEDLNAASIKRSDPDRYKSLKSEGYVRNADIESPAVISVNMQISSLAIIELLSRLHNFRYDDNADSAITRISLTDSYIQKDGEGPVDLYLEKFVGAGDILPMLNMPELND